MFGDCCNPLRITSEIRKKNIIQIHLYVREINIRWNYQSLQNKHNDIGTLGFVQAVTETILDVIMQNEV